MYGRDAAIWTYAAPLLSGVSSLILTLISTIQTCQDANNQINNIMKRNSIKWLIMEILLAIGFVGNIVGIITQIIGICVISALFCILIIIIAMWQKR